MEKKMTQNNTNGIPIRLIAIGVGVVLIGILGITLIYGLVGRNDISTYQVLQGYDGKVEIIAESGYYSKRFGTAWVYPLTQQAYFSASPKEGNRENEGVRVHFNDAGTAEISSFILFSLPVDGEKRLALHRAFGGNMENILHAIHAHLVNCIKSTGPLMSASENQSSRKSEFNQVVEEQLRHGLYQMRRTMVTLRDRLDDKGNPITVEATEVVKDKNGLPIRAEESPLVGYGIVVRQFSITGTDYDPLTLQQFTAKQTAFLSAEKSKAQREQEIQQRLMIEQQGLRQVAEIEAAANQVKAKAITEAQQKVEVASKTKQEAETLADQQAKVATIQAQQRIEVARKEKEAAEMAASQRLAVAEIEKKAAETKASQELAVSDLEAQAAKKRAEGIIALAEAEQKRISIGGAVKEQD